MANVNIQQFLDTAGLNYYHGKLSDWIDEKVQGIDNRIVVNAYGLKGDNSTDNLARFNELYALYPNSMFVFRDGVYCFSDSIITGSTHIYLDNATIKFTSPCTYGIKAMGTQDDEKEHPEASQFITGHGGVIDCNYNATIGIAVGTGKMFDVSNIRICNVPANGTGLLHSESVGVGMSYELNAHDILVENYELFNGTIGVQMGNDSMYTNIVTVNMKTGIKCLGGLNMLHGYHCWNYDFEQKGGVPLKDTIGIDLRSPILMANNCYFDTVETGVITNQASNAFIGNNIYWFSNPDAGSYGKTPVVLSGFGDGVSVSITGAKFNPNIPTYFSEVPFIGGNFTGCLYVYKLLNTPNGSAATGTATGIDAIYSGGKVLIGTSSQNLSNIAVLLKYNNNTFESVSDYTVGNVTIQQGNNVIPITYGTYTDTITVVGVSSLDDDTDTSGPVILLSNYTTSSSAPSISSIVNRPIDENHYIRIVADISNAFADGNCLFAFGKESTLGWVSGNICAYKNGSNTVNFQLIYTKSSGSTGVMNTTATITDLENVCIEIMNNYIVINGTVYPTSTTNRQYYHDSIVNEGNINNTWYIGSGQMNDDTNAYPVITYKSVQYITVE